MGALLSSTTDDVSPVVEAAEEAAVESEAVTVADEVSTDQDASAAQEHEATAGIDMGALLSSTTDDVSPVVEAAEEAAVESEAVTVADEVSAAQDDDAAQVKPVFVEPATTASETAPVEALSKGGTAGYGYDMDALMGGVEPKQAAVKVDVAPAVSHGVHKKSKKFKDCTDKTPSVRHFSFDLDESIENDVDTEVLGLFAAEAEETLGDLDALIVGFNYSDNSFSGINRALHSLKGGSRLCGLLQLASMLHAVEDATTATDVGNKAEAKKLLSSVQKVVDIFRNKLREIVKSESAKSFAGHTDQLVPSQATTTIAPEKSLLRIDPSRLDMVSDLVSRMKISQDRVQRRSQAGSDLVSSMQNPVSRMTLLTQQISADAESRMDSGAQSSKAKNDFDALELDRFTVLHEYTRRLMEAVNDVTNIFDSANQIFQDISETTTQQSELSLSLQSTIDSIGLTTLGSVEPRFKATVRKSADDCAKLCDMSIQGDVLIERAVMDRLVPSVEHLLRNSVAHGIEAPEKRVSSGKAEVGHISIVTKREGSYALVTVMDDGAGVSFDNVRKQAVSKGLIHSGREYTREDLVEMLFSPGFSTVDAKDVTGVAGRGVGLDAVRQTINKLGGRVMMKSTEGQGTRFDITVPMNSGYVSGLMIEAMGSPYIIPSTYIRGVELVSGGDLASSLAQPGSIIAAASGCKFSVYEVGFLCGLHHMPALGNYHQVIALNGISDKVIYGDRIEYVNEFPLRQFSSDVPVGLGVIGYSLLSDGRIAVVINPEYLINSVREADRKPLVADRTPSVLIVDDSITVRTVSMRLMKKHGIECFAAENGSIALEKINEKMPAAILMDIEMPVLDGFETTRAIKANPATKHIPIAIISSRNAGKHIAYAKSMGADAFFGKPYKDSDLIDWVNEMIAQEVVV